MKAPASKSQPVKPFKFGWVGDGGLGERLIEAILAGGKRATSSPAYDPEDADVREGDRLELIDKNGRPRATLVATKVELRPFSTFDEALARLEGTTLAELREGLSFANGRTLAPDEEMRVIYFKLLHAYPRQRRQVRA